MSEPRDDNPFDPEDSVRVALSRLGRSHVCTTVTVEEVAIRIDAPHNPHCSEQSRELLRNRFPAE